MPQFAAKHYSTLAQFLAETREYVFESMVAPDYMGMTLREAYTEGLNRAFDTIIGNLGNLFQDDNPKFNRDKILAGDKKHWKGLKKPRMPVRILGYFYCYSLYLAK